MTEHKVGRELDALVAELMGWQQSNHPLIYHEPGNNEHVWVIDAEFTPRTPYKRFLPDTDISAAWLVVEKFASERNKVVRLTWAYLHDKYVWECAISQVQPQTAPTAPLAICRAALKAISV